MEHKTVCMPFAKTGYCKLGNSCKYAHIRVTSDTDSVKCGICKNISKRSVILNCNHKFCYNCLLDSLTKKHEICQVCKINHHGIFYLKDKN